MEDGVVSNATGTLELMFRGVKVDEVDNTEEFKLSLNGVVMEAGDGSVLILLPSKGTGVDAKTG